jgi:hypothetical protein
MIERAHGADGDPVRVEFNLTRKDFNAFAQWQILHFRAVRRLAVVVGGQVPGK